MRRAGWTKLTAGLVLTVLGLVTAGCSSSQSADQKLLDRARPLPSRWNSASGDLAAAVAREDRAEVIRLGHAKVPELTRIVDDFREVAASAPRDDLGRLLRSLAKNYQQKLIGYVSVVNGYKLKSKRAVETASKLLRDAAAEGNRLTCRFLRTTDVPEASIPKGVCAS